RFEACVRRPGERLLGLPQIAGREMLDAAKMHPELMAVAGLDDQWKDKLSGKVTQVLACSRRPEARHGNTRLARGTAGADLVEHEALRARIRAVQQKLLLQGRAMIRHQQQRLVQ